MAQVDFNERQLTLKLVYFGPPLSGKTTNLRALHGKVDALNRGRLMTLETRDDRTLFFDLLPIFFRSNGLSFRIKVYTVPGQPMHEATRRVVLQGADGVVFVADSSPDKAGANRESWVGLGKNLTDLGLRIPVIVQYNKRDLADAVALTDADRFDEPERPLYPAHAVAGDGVLPTFLAALQATWDQLEGAMRLGQKFGLAGDDFMRTVCGHVGGDERDIVAR
ncbi:MAG TPA: GTPase domain-containing protein [Kofleriaceae bacterium]|nr:GTPase domain-containing protein [Kofleriaceae bacterium]